MPQLLHIRTSGGANSEANDGRTNHIFASSFIASFALLFVASFVLSFVASFVSPFVALALKAGFPTRVKCGTNNSFVLRAHTHVKTVYSHRDRGIQMFVQVARQGRSTNV